MSFDLAVWYPDARLTTKEAGKRYICLCEDDSSMVTPHPAVDAFYAEITALHPEIGDVPADEVDECPWNIEFDRSPGHLIMCCAWSRAEYCYDLILRLARKHGLCVFDPQTGAIHFPDAKPAQSETKSRPWWKFWRGQ